MVAFFDSKQEVLDVELTKYGEYLLSIGKFNPAYYSFYDDNVLYDTRYASFSSSQNENEPRVQEDTPLMRAQSNFDSIEDEIRTFNNYIDNNKRLREDQKVRFPSTVDKHFTSLYAPLGNSDLVSNKAPAWNMRFYHGKMLDWSIAYTGSHASKHIPQIETDITYVTKVRSTDNQSMQDQNDSDVDERQLRGAISYADPVLRGDAFPDGTYVEVEGDYILLELEEKNAVYDIKNFDIEVYEVKTETLANGNTRDELIPLKFRTRPKQIVNDLLVDTEVEEVPLDPSYVEYYFDIFIDEQINESTFCKSIERLKSRGFYTDRQFTEFNCPENSNVLREDIYGQPQNISSTKCEDETPVGSGNASGVS
jgi:hypothetical protein